jgi:ABC transporter family protein
MSVTKTVTSEYAEYKVDGIRFAETSKSGLGTNPPTYQWTVTFVDPLRRAIDLTAYSSAFTNEGEAMRFIVAIGGIYADYLEAEKEAKEVAWFKLRDRVGRIGFYVLFAVMVTVSVQLVGVYLVFTSLIIPAIATYRYPPKRQLAIGYGLTVVSYVVGLAASSVLDLPSSPVIVWAMAVVGTIVHLAAGNGKVPPLHAGAK